MSFRTEGSSLEGEAEAGEGWVFWAPEQLVSDANAAASARDPEDEEGDDRPPPSPVQMRRRPALRAAAPISFNATYEHVSNPRIPKSRTGHGWSRLERGTWFRVSTFAGRLPLWLQAALCTLHIIVDLALGVAYVEAQSHDEQPRTFQRHDPNMSYFYFKLACCTFFAFLWVFHVGVLGRVKSLYTAITAITCGWQLAYAFAWPAIGDEIGLYYAPIFLRCWVVRMYLQRLFQLWPIGDPRHAVHRDIVSNVLLLLCIMYSCMGVYRVVETFQGYSVSLNACFYLMTVTFSTAGFGDVTPQTTWGRIVIIFTIFIAMAVLPHSIAVLQEGFAAAVALNSYDGTSRHVIIVGSVTFKEALVFLHEFVLHSTTRCLVFVSSEPFPARVHTLRSHPLFRGRMHLIVGDIAERFTMERCKAARADAIFLLSDKCSVVCRGDYKLLRDSVAVHRFEPRLPQYLWLKYGTHDFLLKSIFTSIHREWMKKSLAGIALVHPGSIPFLANLFSTYMLPQESARADFSATADPDEWRSLYVHSRANEIYTMTPPDTMDGMPFEKAAWVLLRDHSMILVAVGKPDLSLRVNPRQLRLSATAHILLVIARSRQAVQAAASSLRSGYFVSPRGCATTDASIAEEEPMSPTFAGGPEFASPSTDPGDMGELLAASLTCSPTLLQLPARRESVGDQVVHDAHAADHYVIVDQNTAVHRGDLSDHEHDLAARFRTEDLLLVVQTIKVLRPKATVCLVSVQPPLQAFYEACETCGIAGDVTHVRGSALTPSTLDAAKIDRARGILVYSSVQDSRVLEDSPLYAVDSFIRLALLKREQESEQDQRHEVSGVNVVVEASTFTAARLLNPQHTFLEWKRKSEVDFQLSMPFLTGKLLSADMFQTLLVQSFYCPFIIKFLEYLLMTPAGVPRRARSDSGDRGTEPFSVNPPSPSPVESQTSLPNTTFAYAQQRSALRTRSTRIGGIKNDRVLFETFGDAFRAAMVHLGVVLVGVFRQLPRHAYERTTGSASPPRYFITNPPCAAQLLPTDELYFIQ